MELDYDIDVRVGKRNDIGSGWIYLFYDFRIGMNYMRGMKERYRIWR